MSSAGLLWSVLFGSLGAGYCVYGRKQRALVPGLCGLALMVLPYFVSNTYLMVATCSALAALPFVWRP